MRVGLVRNVGLSISALAVLAMGACDDNPLSFNVKDTTGIFTNPSAMVVPAGRTTKLESRAVNQGNEPTFDAVAAAVDPSCGSGAITVEPDPEALDIQPPGLYVVTGGSVLGQSCVNLTSGSNSAVVEVTVVTEDIEIVSAPDQLRAGETGQVVAQLIDAAGSPVGPYAAEDANFASDATDVADFTDEVGNFSTSAAGSAVLTVTWAGQEANGTSGLGVIRSVDHALTVLPNVPASAEFATAIPGLGAGEDATVEVLVLDALGNQNTDAAEITGCTVSTSDAAVATATCEVVAGADPTDPVAVEVTVTAVGPGTADISGTVLVSTGPPIPFGPSTVTVIAPSITALSATSGTYAQTITITGAGFIAVGFETLVTVDGLTLGNFTVNSDTDITAQMPTFGTAGTFDVVVSVGGLPSPAVSWTQTAGFDIKAFEPANEIPETAVVISVPAVYSGTFADGAVSGDLYDFVRYTMSGDDAVLYAIDWSPAKDLDGIEFTCFDSADVFTFACFSGVFIDPSGGSANGAGTAGDWLWVMNDFDAEVNGTPTAVVYNVSITVD